jgi:ABC-2 type transport system permease protein
MEATTLATVPETPPASAARATTAPVIPPDVAVPPLARFVAAVGDGLAVAGRNLRAMSRAPEVIVFGSIQPIMLVLVFRYVFSGAIEVPNVDYVDYLMPGIFVQTVIFGALNTVVGLSEDLRRGMVERFRSLPMARSAVLLGRTTADMVRNVVVVTLMATVGFVVGFRVHTNVLAFLAAIGVLLTFAFAVSWLFATVALSVRSAEAAQSAVFPPMTLLVFGSTAFVPVESMPDWLQGWSDNQPVSAAVDAVRALVLGGPTAGPVLQSLAWSLGMLAVFAFLSARVYQRRA